MKLLSTIIFLICIGCNQQMVDESSNIKAENKYENFGAPFTLAEEPSSVKEAIDQKKFGSKIIVSGKIDNVCQKKGCWMIIQDGTHSVRTTFKDYGFFVPKDSSGKNVVIEGIFSEKVITEADARHYAEDAGKSPEEIEKIKGDKYEYTIVADAVKIYE